MEVLDSMFGSCFRSIIWGANGNQRNKYIDYMPSKKWKYKDENLMYELSDRQSWDMADFTEDELYEDRIPNSIKVRLHDNVFLNPLNDNNNANKITTPSTEGLVNENSRSNEDLDTTYESSNAVIADDVSSKNEIISQETLNSHNKTDDAENESPYANETPSIRKDNIASDESNLIRSDLKESIE